MVGKEEIIPKARILIMDGEPHLSRVTSRLLQTAGYQVTEASTGKEGLRLARELKPDLALLDAILPDLDGLKVCRDIKADVELSDTFVVMLSGKKTTPDNQVEGLEGGADDYIVRPVSNRELLARVEAMLRIQRSEVRLRAKTHELQERVKELGCLFDISELLEKADTCLPEILQGTVVLIPPAWQYPEITCARILLDGQEYRTKNFRETAWKLARDILVRGEQAGRVEVGYLEERPGSDEGPFLHEERKLLNAIAERLGRVIERVRAEEALRQSQERYRAVS